MLRWLLIVLLALILLQGLMGWLRKVGFGRLPGDFEFRFLGKTWYLPIASTLLLSMLAAAAARFL